jgi:membrane-associated protein
MIELIQQFVHFVLHLDTELVRLFEQYGLWVYAILFLIVFLETGLVVTPILPGDSLLFAAGALCALPGSTMNVTLLVVLLIAAAFIGDTVNYSVGRLFGQRLIAWDKGRFIKPAYIAQTRAFFVKHGGKAVILARFAPIIRTYAPFVAGLAEMPRQRFMAFNAVGGMLWVASFTIAGFLFGNLPVVKEYFHLLIVGIIAVSLIPVVWQFIAARRSRSPALSDVR